MTREEFNKGFRTGSCIKRKGSIYKVVTVDFEEDLIGFFLDETDEKNGIVTWVRFENCDIVK